MKDLNTDNSRDNDKGIPVNRFKYKSNEKRIMDLKINRISLGKNTMNSAVDGSSDSFFRSELATACELNLTKEFCDFHQLIKLKSSSLSLLLFNKKFILLELLFMLGLESCTTTQHDDTMDTIQHDGTMDTTQHDGTMDTLNTTTTQHDESTGRTSANQCRMDALEIRVVPLVGSANDPPVYDARITALQLLQCLFMDLQEEMLEFGHVIFYTLTRQLVVHYQKGQNQQQQQLSRPFTDRLDYLYSSHNDDDDLAAQKSEYLFKLALQVSAKTCLANVGPDLVREIFLTCDAFFKHCCLNRSGSICDPSIYLVDLLPFLKCSSLHLQIFTSTSFAIIFRKLSSIRMVKTATTTSNVQESFLHTLLTLGARVNTIAMQKGAALLLRDTLVNNKNNKTSKSGDKDKESSPFHSKAQDYISLITQVFSTTTASAASTTTPPKFLQQVWRKLWILIGHLASSTTALPFLQTLLLLPQPQTKLLVSPYWTDSAIRILTSIRQSSRLSIPAARLLLDRTLGNHDMDMDVKMEEGLSCLMVWAWSVPELRGLVQKVLSNKKNREGSVSVRRVLDLCSAVACTATTTTDQDQERERDKDRDARLQMLWSHSGLFKALLKNGEREEEEERGVIVRVLSGVLEVDGVGWGDAELQPSLFSLIRGVFGGGEKKKGDIDIGEVWMEGVCRGVLLLERICRHQGESRAVEVEMEFVVLFLQKLLDGSSLRTQHQDQQDVVGFVCAFIVEKLSSIDAFTRKLRSISTLPLSLVSLFWQRSGTSPDVFYYTALRVALTCLDEGGGELKEWRTGFAKEMGGARLLTSQPKIREQVLLTLSTLFPDPNHMMNEVVLLCLEMENTPLSIAQEREWPILLNRLENAVLQARRLDRDQDDDAYSMILQTSVSFLLSLYSCRFTPVFKYVGQVLSKIMSMGSQERESVWTLYWNCLTTLWDGVGHCMLVQAPTPAKEFMSSSRFICKEVEAIVEQEQEEEGVEKEAEEGFSKREKPLASFQCSHLNKLDRVRGGYIELINSFGFQGVQGEWFDSGVDVDLWICQLLEFLALVPTLLLEKSRLLNTLFFQLVKEDEDQQQVTSFEKVGVAGISKRKKKLTVFLSSFSKVSQPRKLDKSSEFYTVLTHLVSNGDTKLQTLALDCIKNWQYPLFHQYMPVLQSLAQDGGSRVTDVLATFDLDVFHASSIHQERTRVMDLFVRLLYGKLVTRQARASQAVVKSRVSGVFGFLCREGCEEYRDLMVKLMLDPLKSSSRGGGDGAVQGYVGLSKQLVGFLGLVQDFIKILQRYCVKYLDSFIQVFLGAIRECEHVLAASSSVNGQTDLVIDDLMDVDDDDVDVEEDSLQEQNYLLAKARNIRTLTLKRFCLLFHIDVVFDFSPYIAPLFECCLNGRIEKLAIENTQAPSVLLDLFLVWSRSTSNLPFLELNPNLICNILLICSAKKVHESVIIRVLEIIESIQDVHDMAPHLEYLPRLFQNNLGLLLEQCKLILFTNPIKLHSPESIPNKIIRILSRVSVFVKESDIAAGLLEILVPFLKASSKAVPESSKVEILRILAGFYPTLEGISLVDPTTTSYYSIACQLFSTLETAAARQELLRVFDVFVKFDGALEKIVLHLHDLNAMSTKRIDEVDFDRRFTAYSQINQVDYKIFTPCQWKPILYNHICQVGDDEEYSVRTSAAFGLTRFIEIVKERGMPEDYFSLIQHIVFPHVKKGLKVSEKLVRYEWIKLWGTLVETFSLHSLFADMTCLLGVDDETNFFSNITHIQMHRRLKAVRMLTGLTGSIKPSNITHLLSVLCHFIYGSGEGDHNLINDSMACIASCSSVLAWGQYYNLIKRFMNSIKFRPELEKVLVRLIVLVLDEFHFGSACGAPKDIDPSAPEAAPDDKEGEEEEEDDVVLADAAEQAVQSGRIQIAVTSKLIPSLQQLLAVKDDETLSVRTPLAVAITKLLKQLPLEVMHGHLPKLLLTLCNFLSSHLQSSRDSARSTLVSISKMLGPVYLSYIIKGLTTALTRGYQLHVLGYTLHAIISENAASYQAGSIDSCVGAIVKICVQDIFGETGKEREVQELKGKMREIKITKSFETLEHLCKVISFHQVNVVLLPIKEQMLETNDIKIIQHIQNVFRRLSVGLNANESIDAVHFMVFVQQLLSESLPLAQVDDSKKRATLTEAEKRVQVLMKRNEASVALKYYEVNVHMFVEFGLSLLLTSLKREKISPKIPEHLEMLDPLVPHIGRALYAKHASITVLALRILCIIIKLPLPELDESTAVFVKRMFQLISRSSSTDGELIQAVFKLLVIVLRDCKHVSIPERQIITLLALLTPDLEDPEKETTTFSLIRSILERKYVTNEVYDLMDVVSRILVTSQSNHVRELCRGCYIHFLVYYPHGHARLRKQIAYLVSNLEYEFESGRISVLELFHLAISKFSDEVFKEYSDMLFLSIVLVLANDDSPKCREMSGLLIKELCVRLGFNRMEKPLLLINKWFDQADPGLHKVSCQVVGLFVDAFGGHSKVWIPAFLQRLTDSLEKCYQEWQSRQEDFDELDQDLHLWELGYFALKSISKIIKVFPAFVIVEGSELVWRLVSDLLLHPHSWIRSLCSQLLGNLFAHIDPATRKLVGSLASASAHSSSSLVKAPYPILSRELDLKDLAKKFTNQLDSDLVTIDIAKQIVKNLLFLSKAMVPFISKQENDHKDDQDDSDMGEDVDEKADGRASPLTNCSLAWLTKRMCFLARSDASKKRGNVLRISVFQWFAAIYKHIPTEHRHEYLKMMILTLYLVERDETKKGEDADTLKQLATEVLAALQKETGTTEYVNVYQAVHEKVLQNRREKKTNRAIMAVSDPKKHAIAQMKRSVAKVNARKRKAQDFANKKMKNGHSIKLKKAKVDH